jgi:hypothetical protein
MRESMVMEPGNGVPCEVLGGGETMRLDSAALVDLIEKSEGIEAAQKFASGTPGLGMPQVEEAAPESGAEIEMNLARGSEIDLELPPVAIKQPSRLFDLAIGGALSVLVMAAWYCATQL